MTIPLSNQTYENQLSKLMTSPWVFSNVYPRKISAGRTSIHPEHRPRMVGAARRLAVQLQQLQPNGGRSC